MKYGPTIVDNELLYYEIRNDEGMYIGSAIQNQAPFDGCDPVTLKDAEANARLWAASDAMLQALLDCEVTLKAFLPDAFATISVVEQAIKKAKP